MRTAGVFSLESIKEAVNRAVQEACKHDDEKRKQMLRQMQLRWHPGVLLLSFYHSYNLCANSLSGRLCTHYAGVMQSLLAWMKHTSILVMLTRLKQTQASTFFSSDFFVVHTQAGLVPGV